MLAKYLIIAMWIGFGIILGLALAQHNLWLVR